MKSSPALLVLVYCLLSLSLCAQDKLKLKYGKIAAADFDLSGHRFDTSESAHFRVKSNWSISKGVLISRITISPHSIMWKKKKGCRYWMSTLS